MTTVRLYGKTDSKKNIKSNNLAMELPDEKERQRVTSIVSEIPLRQDNKEWRVCLEIE